MAALRCIVVEDEPLALERMVDYVGRLPVLELAGAFDNATDARARLQANDIDLVFLDIRLAGLSGIELLETGSVRARVILTTAHQEYAVRAFDLDVIDYLVKPFTFERFVRAVERVQPAPEFIFVKSGQRLERIPVADILFIEGQRDYRRIHTTSKRLMTLQTFGEFERLVPPRLLCRVHKSYMVAPGRIDTIERGEIRIGDMRIPISETYRGHIMSVCAPRNFTNR
jgi:two-component system, LytTR family, response regulator